MSPASWGIPARLAAGAASGGLLSLSFEPVGLPWIAPFALIPLLLALRGRSAWGSGLAGAGFGAVFYGILMHWISLFGILAVVVLSLAAAAFFAAWAILASLVGRRFGRLGRLAGVPLLWAGFEVVYTRWPLGGLGWGVLGSSQVGGSAMLPLARLAGVTVLGAAVLAVNALLAEIIADATAGEGRGDRSARARRPAALAGGALVLLLGPGFLPLGPDATAGTFDVAAVQGNVPPDRFRGFGQAGRVGPEDTIIIENHLRVSRRLLDGQAPDLVVWPENAFDRDPRTNPGLYGPVQSFVRELGAPLILPAILDEQDGFANANLLVDARGEAVARYDKVHLVPFGEYVPWGFARDLVPALRVEIPRDGVPGERMVAFDVGDTRVGTMICFESTYPWYARDLARADAALLIVTTNNASYQRSPAAQQHLAQSRMRAVETGRTVVHAAISGISAIILPDGTVTQRSALFEEDLLRETVTLGAGRTPAVRYGEAIEWALLGLALLLALAAIATGRRA